MPTKLNLLFARIVYDFRALHIKILELRITRLKRIGKKRGY